MSIPLPVTVLLFAVAIAVAVVIAASCASPRPAGPDEALYGAALADTAASAALIRATPEVYDDALERFETFYEVYSSDRIRDMVRDVYAEDAYFGDPIHNARGIDEIERYFLRMAEPVASCTFDLEGIDAAGGEVYIRWVMRLAIAQSPDDPIEARGISHVRFGPDGLIIFQQDYWDTSAMMDRIPLVGYFTRLVKQRLEE